MKVFFYRFVSVDMLARKTGLEAREVAKVLGVSAECRLLLYNTFAQMALILGLS